jgi:tetratricopeptide (TPR) repeat protein
MPQARALRRQGRFDDATSALAAVHADDASRPTVLSEQARLAFQSGRVDEAVVAFREAIALHRERGEISQAADDASTLVFLLVERSRIAEARETVRLEAEVSGDFPVGAADSIHGEGLLAWATGDLRTAVRREREAEARFARLGVERRRRAVALTLGLRLQELGRYADSIETFRALLASPDAAPCEKADLLNDVGWSAVQAREVDPHGAEGVDATGALLQSRDLYRAACPDPNRLASTLENLALAELEQGRLAEARSDLAQARAAGRDPPVTSVTFWHHLAGRIALEQAHPEAALEAFAHEDDIASALGSVQDRLRATEGEAAALALLGRRAQALQMLEASDALLDTLSATVPLGEGVDAFVRTRERTALRHVEMLVQMGRDAQALQTARRWRTRALDGLRVAAALEQLDPEARGRWQDAVGRYRALRDGMEAESANDWELPADRLAAARARRDEGLAQARTLIDDALSVLPRAHEVETSDAPPAPGELELLWLPAPSAWLGFARTHDRLAIRRLDAWDVTSNPLEAARVLLEPFDTEIAAAERVRLMPVGAARELDLHALPWRGRPLIDHVVVEYALGLGSRASSLPATRSALLVADPGGDLPAARSEADSVAHALTAGGWHVRDLRGAAADGQIVRGELARVALLHYAGHATFGGLDGSGSALSLAHGSRLTPADVLALPRVPPIVSLFGCDTAHESVTGRIEALGLTSAFLVAGARAVVATSRAVDDGLARDVAARFSKELGASGDAAAALQRAVVALRDERPSEDWAAFRAWVP